MHSAETKHGEASQRQKESQEIQVARTFYSSARGDGNVEKNSCLLWSVCRAFRNPFVLKLIKSQTQPEGGKGRSAMGVHIPIGA